MTKVSVVGLGKLGACMAACCASRGFPTIGVDINPEVVRLVNKGRAPVFEPGLGEVMAGAGKLLRATRDYREAIHGSDMTFVVVPTPSEDHGGFSLTHVKQAMEEVGKALKDKPGYHIVDLVSTVMPGATEQTIIPILERESGKRLGADFGVCYDPEFVALGSVIRDMLRPAFVLIGESDEQAGDRVSVFYHELCENAPPIVRMNFVNAELTKLALNVYITMKINFANMLGNLCEKLPGGDVDAVTAAIGLDPRISSRCFKAGLGFGGPCFPRDNRALTYLTRQLGTEASIAETTDRMNRALVGKIVKRILSLVRRGSTIAVLGLAYKLGTDVVEESQGLEIARRLFEEEMKVAVYDPLAMDKARKILGDNVRYCESIADCVTASSLVVIANPSESYREFFQRDFSKQSVRLIIMDCWRILDRACLGKQITYVGLGLGDHRGEPRTDPVGAAGSASVSLG